ncbi:MAG: hypothetical protein JXN59_02665 [Anaerolineae bacterium]|nr:hypothetical protein [Anaerolineae bacterium]
MHEQSSYEMIRRGVERRWKRRLIWAASVVGFVFFVFLMVPGRLYRYFDPYGNVTFVVLVVLLGVVALHTLVVLVAELRERALRKEIERERRWRILERLGDLPEPQRAMTRLLLEEDGELPDEFADWLEKPKRDDMLA